MRLVGELSSQKVNTFPLLNNINFRVAVLVLV